ncbi:iron-containing alcohol dehydrogenase [Clostridium paraputrificum]|uniref:iron-containing alcohol dehydrogenase n=1 Tax=Clostridium TaxID=1485 RepID=UPI003D33F2DD
MARFTLPRDIYHGKGTIDILKEISGKKAMIVMGGGSMKRFGFLQKIEDNLKEAGLEVEIFDGVESDPSVETVMKGAEAMRKFEPDWIIGLGGGSPIDAAKAMWIFYENPDFTFEEAVVPFGLPKLRKKAKFIAIASTSGTATEVTAFSVITNYDEKIKYPLADFEITPDIAIVDPDLAETMPPKLVAFTGMDAMTHAIEAYVSTIADNFSDPLALKAIEMVRDNIKASYAGDLKARSEMHDAQCLAGMAFSNVSLGIVHSMAHKIGGVFHVPHGCANAILLPSVIEFNSRECEHRYADIAKMLKLEGNNNAELTKSLVELIRELNKELNVPATFKEYGVDEEEFKANIEYMSKNSVIDACTATNPRKVDAELIRKIYEAAYNGEEVAF